MKKIPEQPKIKLIDCEASNIQPAKLEKCNRPDEKIPEYFTISVLPCESSEKIPKLHKQKLQLRLS